MKVIRKCLCVCLALIVSLSVYKSNSAFAEMHGVAQQQKIDSGNAFYCTYDKITETVFFLISGASACGWQRSRPAYSAVPSGLWLRAWRWRPGRGCAQPSVL